METWTVYARWEDGDVEEVDVHAASAEEAKRLAFTILDRDYRPGWEIIAADPLSGLTIRCGG
jgi:hypothetical protein